MCASSLAGRRAREIFPLVDGRTCPPRDDAGIGPGGAVLLVTLTHRDAPPRAETLLSALDRFSAARDRLRRYPESAAWLAATIEGAAWTTEITGGASGLSWHPHLHGIVRLLPGVSVERWRDEIAARWRAATELAGGALGGWDRASGIDASGAERWCALVTGARQVQQACSYAVTLAGLGRDPLRWAEYLAVVARRRLVAHWGRWAADPAWREWARVEAKRDAKRERELAELAGGAPPGGGPTGPGITEAKVLEQAIEYDTVIFAAGAERPWRDVALRARAWELVSDAARLRRAIADQGGDEAIGWRIEPGPIGDTLRAAAEALAVHWRSCGATIEPRCYDLRVALGILGAEGAEWV